MGRSLHEAEGQSKADRLSRYIAETFHRRTAFYLRQNAQSDAISSLPSYFFLLGWLVMIDNLLLCTLSPQSHSSCFAFVPVMCVCGGEPIDRHVDVRRVFFCLLFGKSNAEKEGRHDLRRPPSFIMHFACACKLL